MCYKHTVRLQKHTNAITALATRDLQQHASPTAATAATAAAIAAAALLTITNDVHVRWSVHVFGLSDT
jgi:redox-regulated HSP33 family molecular chaperone